MPVEHVTGKLLFLSQRFLILIVGALKYSLNDKIYVNYVCESLVLTFDLNLKLRLTRCKEPT